MVFTIRKSYYLGVYFGGPHCRKTPIIWCLGFRALGPTEAEDLGFGCKGSLMSGTCLVKCLEWGSRRQSTADAELRYCASVREVA